MEVGSICSREVDTATPGETVTVIAKRMLQRNVGSLVVVDDARKPIGIVTDRDLTLRVLAAGRPSQTAVREIMTPEPHCAREGYAIEAALSRMQRTPCRRLPVVDENDVLIGILTLDDIHEYHAEEAGMMGTVLRRENPETLADD